MWYQNLKKVDLGYFLCHQHIRLHMPPLSFLVGKVLIRCR